MKAIISLSNKNTEQQALSSVQKAARAGSFTILLLIFAALFFGRSLEKAFPSISDLLPYVGGLCLAVVLWMLYQVIQQARLHSLSKAKLTQSAILAALGVSVALIGASQLVVAPIERVHFVKYGLLGFCFFFWNRREVDIPKCVSIFVITALVGGLEEGTQYFLPSRVFDLRDLLLNAIGAAIGVLLASSIALQIPHSQQSEGAD